VPTLANRVGLPPHTRASRTYTQGYTKSPGSPPRELAAPAGTTRAV